ncbi:uncharacterized protein [Argopecten irradians]|uniref:uncharacterized protein n=1 Tax=Argopecten irradians TaxID=31199 RepID=UPI003713D265
MHTAHVYLSFSKTKGDEMAEHEDSSSSVSGDSNSGSDDEVVDNIEIDPGFLPNDVVLIVEDQRLHVNRDLLVSVSPVFEAWLKKEWQGDQQTESGKVELSIPRKSLKDITTFLKCLLPSFSDKVSVETLDIVLPLADEYQTESLLSECFHVIRRHIESVFTTNSDISADQIVKYLHFIEQYEPDNDDIKTDIVSIAACEKMEKLEAVEEFDDIGEALQLEIAKKSSKLLEVLFMSRLSDIEQKIHRKKPFGNVHHVNAYFLRKRKDSVQLLLEQTLNHIKDFEKSVSSYNVSSTPMGELLLCLSVSDTLEISTIYNKCITKLSSIKITNDQFRT